VLGGIMKVIVLIFETRRISVSMSFCSDAEGVAWAAAAARPSTSANRARRGS
jgi:hypothetical protein